MAHPAPPMTSRQAAMMDQPAARRERPAQAGGGRGRLRLLGHQRLVALGAAPIRLVRKAALVAEHHVRARGLAAAGALFLLLPHRLRPSPERAARPSARETLPATRRHCVSSSPST